MNGFGEVYGSLQAMTHLQLLLAFVACIGYAFAQGKLLTRTGRRVAWLTTLSAAVGFACMSDDWSRAIVLTGIGVAGMGSFVALVWLMSRALGFTGARAATPIELLGTEPSDFTHKGARTRGSLPSDHAHSI